MQNSNVKKTPVKNYFKNFWKYRYLVQEIVRKNIKLQYRNSFLGIFWTFLQPLLTMIVLVFVFTNIFGSARQGVVSYPVYLLCGRLLYEFFTQSTKRAMHSIRNSASIIKKVYVPKYIYPLSNVISTFITFCISLTVLIVVVLYVIFIKGDPVVITPYIFLAWVPIVILFLLSCGTGLLLSVLNVFFKDVEYIYDVFCMLLFYATPIFYNLNTMNMNPTFAFCIKLNPLYSIIQMFRACILYGPQWNAFWNDTWLFYSLGFSLVLLIVGAFVFYKNQDKFILHI